MHLIFDDDECLNTGAYNEELCSSREPKQALWSRLQGNIRETELGMHSGATLEMARSTRFAEPDTRLTSKGRA